MKKIFLFSVLIISFVAQAQELPTITVNGFAFPIGTKFTIKLYAVDSTNDDFSIIAFEPFEETIDIWGNENLFDIIGQDSTISFSFCFGTSSETEEEREENMKIVLVFKNYSSYALQYVSEIMREEEGDFENTSNVGTYPGAQTTEMWPYMIYMIGLHGFQNY